MNRTKKQTGTPVCFFVIGVFWYGHGLAAAAEMISHTICRLFRFSVTVFFS